MRPDNSSRETDAYFRLRLPDYLHVELKEAAQQNRRSITAEILMRIEHQRKHDGQAVNSGSSALGIRDYFAGQALCGLLSGPDDELHVREGESVDDALARSKRKDARWCFQMAEAMIADRDGNLNGTEVERLRYALTAIAEWAETADREEVIAGVEETGKIARRALDGGASDGRE